MTRLPVRHIPYSQEFNGTDSEIDFGVTFQKERTDKFSVSFWFYPQDGTSTQTTIGNRDATTSTGWEILFGTTDNTFRWALDDDSGGQAVIDTGIVPLNAWGYYTFTYDGSSNASGLKAYRNGLALSTTTVADTLSSTIVSGDKTHMGARSGTLFYLLGKMADVRIHNDELTAAEVLDAYFENVHTDVEAYWPGTEGHDTTLADSVGSANGTMTNVTWSTSSPFLDSLSVRDTYNALEFTATTNNVAWVDHADLDVTNITIELWWKHLSLVGAIRDIVGKWQHGVLAEQSILFDISAADAVNWGVNIGGTQYIHNTGITMPLNEWHHWVCTWDGTDLAVYQDGRVFSIGTPAASGNINNGNADLRLGARDGEENNSAIGKMALFRMWGSAATPSQVEDLHYRNQVFASPIIEALFTDESGSTLTNTGSHSANGTITGASWSTSTPFEARTAIS